MLAEEISAFTQKLDALIAEWTTTHTDYWPFEPPGGQYVREDTGSRLREEQIGDSLRGASEEMKNVELWMGSIENSWAAHRASLAKAPLVHDSTASTTSTSGIAPSSASTRRRKDLSTLRTATDDLETSVADYGSLMDTLNEQIREADDRSKADDKSKEVPAYEPQIQHLATLVAQWTQNIDRLEEEVRKDPDLVRALKANRDHLSAGVQRVRPA